MVEWALWGNTPKHIQREEGPVTDLSLLTQISEVKFHVMSFIKVDNLCLNVHSVGSWFNILYLEVSKLLCGGEGAMECLLNMTHLSMEGWKNKPFSVVILSNQNAQDIKKRTLTNMENSASNSFGEITFNSYYKMVTQPSWY